MAERQYQIVPYTVHDGVPSFRDSEIAGWFERLVEEGSLQRLFFDGTVVYARDLIRLVKSPGVFFFTVWTVKKEEVSGAEPATEMAALFWMRDFIGNAAFMHHAVFKKFWGGESRKIGRYVLEYIFGVGGEDRPPLVGTLLGLTPMNNIPAVRFARALGMKPAGRIPGVFYDVYETGPIDGIMTCMTRETCLKTRKES